MEEKKAPLTLGDLDETAGNSPIDEAALFGEKTIHDLVEELLYKLFSYNPQTVINWVNKMRRNGYALGSGPLEGLTKREKSKWLTSREVR